jgi:hypothetical protein
MVKKKDKDFILILSDIGENPEKSEYLFRIMGIMVEIPPSEFPKKY